MCAPSSIRLTKKQVLNSGGESRPRSHCPNAMPATAGTSIASDDAAVEPEKTCCAASPKPRASVETVKEIPYFAFVLTHELELDPIAEQITQVVLFTIAASVVLHGISATPIMTLYKNRKPGNITRNGNF